MPKVLTVVGARPQFIKAAPVSRALARAGVREVLLHTGQHYDENMSDVFFREMGLEPPHHQLAVGSGAHGAQTARILEGVERVICTERPDWVLVYGDTNSTLAGALAAVKLHVPVAHVEAGLRSFDRRMPEEVNRVLTDHAAALLFAPTDHAVAHLAAEGIRGPQVQQVGDVMYDAVRLFGDATRGRALPDAVRDLPAGGYVLATVHRAENTDSAFRLTTLVRALGAVAREMPVVFPLHPRTRSALEAAGATLPPGVVATAPIGYLDMLALQGRAAVIVTDSGGVQKEAFFAEVPCVTVRDTTEWTELLDLGWNRLVGAEDAQRVADAVLAAVGTRGRAGAPYGDGRAAERVAAALVDVARTGTLGSAPRPAPHAGVGA